MRKWHSSRAAAGALLLLTLMAGKTAEAADGTPCGHPERQVLVHAITTTLDIDLADGRKLRLPWLDSPQDIAPQARAEMERFTAGHPGLVVLSGPDRWNRLSADLVDDSGESSGESLALTLLRKGLARLRPEPTGGVDGACLDALRTAEAEAIRARAGLWSGEAHRLFRTDEPGRLTSLAGQFVVMQGRIHSIGRRQRRTYINFGADWRTDTTVTIPLRTWRMLEMKGAVAAIVPGRQIRVRGLIESRDGPFMELTLPEDIQVLDMEEGH